MTETELHKFTLLLREADRISRETGTSRYVGRGADGEWTHRAREWDTPVLIALRPGLSAAGVS